MDPIQQQVRRARRRLVLEQFLALIGWTFLGGMAIAALGIAAAKIWVIPVDRSIWLGAWIGGGLAAGLLATIGITAYSRCGMIDAALELDRRFGLKERVSSSLEMRPEETESEMGRALIADVTRRIANIEVREKFQVRAPWTIGLPALAAIVIFLVALLVPDAADRGSRQAKASSETAKVIKKETDRLREQLQEKRERLEAQGLKDADDLLNQLELAIDDMQAKSDLDRKQAMIKVNEMAKMIEERRQQLAGSEDLKKQMDNLKNLQQGPADRIAEALKDGNFKAAIDEVRKLEEKLKSGEMSPEDQKKLADQLAEMKKRLEEVNQAAEQAKRDLREQIKQAQQSGNLQSVNQLQKKLDQLNKMDSRTSQLDKLCESLGQCSQCLANGDAAAASKQLRESMQSLQEMQNDLTQLESLTEMLDELAECKGGLCDGDAMGMGKGKGKSKNHGKGMGEGQGQGDRPEEATDTQSYESRVAAKTQKGRAVIAGTADGPNMPGQSREAIRTAILSDLREKSDPVIDEDLPRDQLEHAREYFKRYVSDDGK